jgi:uncharacterized protein (TIGR03643 family)
MEAWDGSVLGMMRSHPGCVQSFKLYRMTSKHSTASSLSEEDLSRVIEMAWEDRTPFEAIEGQFGLNETQVIELMRRSMKPSSFRMWRKRVTGRNTKHLKLRSPEVSRAYCPTQYKRR